MFPPVILASVWGLVALAGLLNLAWLVLRCCQFSIAQALAASFLYGLTMLICKKLNNDTNDPSELAAPAILNGLAISFGLYIGARNAKKMANRGNARQWFVFFCSLLFVYAALGTFSWALLANFHYSPLSTVPITLISCVCLATTFKCLKGEKIDPRGKTD